MNAAQRIHESLGVPVADGKKLAHGNENASATKAGPGRYHAHGLESARKPKAHGAGADFVLHKNPQKQARRSLMRNLGRRQLLRAIKFQRRVSSYE